MTAPFYVRRVCLSEPGTASTDHTGTLNVWRFDVIEAASGERIARCHSREWAERIASGLNLSAERRVA